MDNTLLIPIFSALAIGLAWIGKEIIKPWSDAYLIRSKAFVNYVETQGKELITLVSEMKTQTTELVKHTELLINIESRSEASAEVVAKAADVVAKAAEVAADVVAKAAIVAAKLK